MGANGDVVPVWGRRRQTVTFANQDFEFDFFLAAVATPIIGMDFLAKFELSILPAKRQVLQAASGRTHTQASNNFFDSPWSPETAAAVAAPGTKASRGIPVPAAAQCRAAQATPRSSPPHRHR